MENNLADTDGLPVWLAQPVLEGDIKAGHCFDWLC